MAIVVASHETSWSPHSLFVPSPPEKAILLVYVFVSVSVSVVVFASARWGFRKASVKERSSDPTTGVVQVAQIVAVHDDSMEPRKGTPLRTIVLVTHARWKDERAGSLSPGAKALFQHRPEGHGSALCIVGFYTAVFELPIRVHPQDAFGGHVEIFQGIPERLRGHHVDNTPFLPLSDSPGIFVAADRRSPGQPT
eukprot:CAMPEP_0172398100 /NCGR_PEP_ID=MMETSP1061-20121228/34210_1 /TAXON_ID=37318 /ORGANISM="Pseudo-nitzschia pungens, Strain cf. pungens" /LENGTH=194 /DNA_ID=CAMNT_0013130467 /DNA_START=16 /DNA_END=596 /DNA_ORIENTATION=-